MNSINYIYFLQKILYTEQKLMRNSKFKNINLQNKCKLFKVYIINHAIWNPQMNRKKSLHHLNQVQQQKKSQKILN